MMVGGRRCGKTSVLAAMKRNFDELFNSKNLVIRYGDTETLDALEDKNAEILDFKYADVCDCPQERVKKIEENNGFYIKMLGKNVDMVMLNQMFGKSLASYCLTRVSPNEICIVKKNNAKMNRFIIVLVGIVLLILAITMVMLLRKK